MAVVAERLGDQRSRHHRERQPDGEAKHWRIRIEMRGKRAERVAAPWNECEEIDVAYGGLRRRIVRQGLLKASDVAKR